MEDKSAELHEIMTLDSLETPEVSGILFVEVDHKITPMVSTRQPLIPVVSGSGYIVQPS